jgi:hypothetical protein
LQVVPCFINYRLRILGELKWMQTWRPRIVNDELFLSAIFVLGGNRKLNAEQLRAALDINCLSVCKHIQTHRRFYRCDPSRLPKREKPTGNVNHPHITPCQQVVGSCSICPTDFEITIECLDGESPEPAWAVTITTHHHIGDCRSPPDWKWTSL